MVVAALGDAQIGVVGRGGQHPVQLLHRGVDAAEAADRTAGRHLTQCRNDLAVAAGAHDAVHLRQLLQDLLLVALGQAAGDQDLAHPALGLLLAHGQNVVNGLALGGVDEAAGVDDHQLHVLRLRAELPARLGHQVHHLLAVHLVLGAAQGDE